MDRLKTFLNKTPVLKKAVKVTFKGALSAQEKRRNAKYSSWIRQFDLTSQELAQQAEEAESLRYTPLISIIAPTYNTPEVFFREMVESVLAQTYSNWELILVDDASPDARVRELITQYAKQDKRIRHLFLKKNLHISGATNEAIKIAKGEFISLFDHDDILRPNALFEVAKALNKNKTLDFIYTDEDKIIEGLESRRDPFFKPSWNPDFLHSVNYITHFTTIRKKVLDNVGYEDGDYNGAQDWELFLRVTRQIPEEHIHHILKVLYSWRIHDASTAKSFSAKPYVVESQRKSIEADLRVKKYTNFSLQQDAEYPGQWQLTFTPLTKGKISIVVRDGKTAGYVKANTQHENVEILTIEKDVDIKTMVEAVTGEFLVIIDSTITIHDSSWLPVLLGDAERKDIGFVTARYKNDVDALMSMQSVISSEATAFISELSPKDLTWHLYTKTRHNIPYVNAGVVMVEVKKLREVLQGGQTIEEISQAMPARGYKNLYNPYVKMVK